MDDAIHFGDSEISYRIRRSRNRSTLSISVSGNSVEVAVPYGLGRREIRPYVRKKAAWILAKLDGIRRVEPLYPRKMQSGETLQYLGRQYQLKVLKGSQDRGVKMKQGRLWLSLQPGDDPENDGAILVKQWYRDHLRTRLQPLVDRFSRQLLLENVRYEVRDLGGRWGSCGKNGRLYFHWQLARLSMAKIEFVCAHELVHLVEPTHSSHFRNCSAV